MILNNFNILEISIWPLFNSLFLLYLLLFLTLGIDFSFNFIIIIIFIIFLYLFFEWILDINIESNLVGRHNIIFRYSIYLGFIFYILSEIFIFLSLFICYLTIYISPSIFLGCSNTNGVFMFNKYGLSITNLLILLIGGIFITICCDELRYKYIFIYLFFSLFYCVIFSYIQYIEYSMSSANITDGAYGSYFYGLSGLHGLHMLIGELIIFIGLIKIYFKNWNINKNLSIVISSINLHFLDVCLIFIYLLVY